jgi:CheY-like chemotaxis protein
VNEVAVIRPAITELIAKGAGSQLLQRAAVEAGMRSLREVATERAVAGDTTLQEIELVLFDVVEATVQAPAPGAAAARQRVLVVDDGDDRLRRLSSGEDWDLAVTDLHMARTGGLEFLRAVRGSVATATLPVIVLTGSSDHDSELAAMDAGADDYIRKPLDPPRLVGRVKAVLRRVTT